MNEREYMRVRGRFRFFLTSWLFLFFIFGNVNLKGTPRFSLGLALTDPLSAQADTLAQDTTAVDTLNSQYVAASAFRKLENKAFQVGEHLVFDIAYKFVVAGTATMSIPDTQWVHGRPCYHVVTTATSSKFFDTFFKVRDKVETFIDMEGLFPWKFEKHIREGNYRTDRYVEYDQVNHRAIHNQKDTLAVPPFVQGVLSSFYYVRTVPLEVRKSFDIDNYGDGKLYPLRVLVHRKMRVEVPAGVFDCIVVEPVLRGEGIFNQKGRLAIWLTDDERRIPVLMKSKVLVGSIDVRLKAIEKQVQ
jgi:hypothetical protein